MLRKFQNFNEELKPETYLRAQQRLKGFGRHEDSTQSKRSKEMKAYADELILKQKTLEKEKIIAPVKDLGTFSLGFYLNQYRGTAWEFSKEISIEETFFKIKFNYETSLVKRLEPPNDAYITKIGFFVPEVFETMDFDCIGLTFYLTPSHERCFETTSFFWMDIAINMRLQDGEEFFEIDDSSTFFANEPNCYFSNRVDAVRFKKLYLNEEMVRKLMPKESFAKLREFFMMYSNHEQYEKFFKKLGQFQTNLLYQ